MIENEQAAAGPDADWPEDDLEHLGQCPMCASSFRETRYSSLQDVLFKAAPGKWCMVRCGACGLYYLDARPSEASIASAYSSYYTHENAPVADGGGGWRQRFVDGLCNDWKARYSQAKPGGRMPRGRWELLFFPGIRRVLHFEVRHMGPPRPGSRLLDLGCGSGEFVALAKGMGWDAEGMEPDERAVKAALSLGLSVQVGGLPNTGLPGGSYDAVTLNHVIEHVHDPVASMKEVLRILKPGGKIWLATPNTNSESHRVYGSAWRGLEPPRHLNLFHAPSITEALKRAGFTAITLCKPKLSSQWFFESSHRIALLQGRSAPDPSGRSTRLRVLVANLRTLCSSASGEELYAVASKPTSV